MQSNTLTPATASAAPLSAKLLLTLLTKMSGGTLVVTLPDATTQTFGSGARHAAIRFNDWAAMGEVLSGGDVKFGESYIEGRWDTPDLAALLTLAAENQAALKPAFYGRWFQQTLFRFRHALRKNTKTQAKKNIVAHYDLGNDFYALWLDETMTYSSALFTEGYVQELPAAQSAKYARALDALNLAPGAHILEVGSGWGGFAEHAAQRGYRVTGLTLSPAQLAFAEARIEKAGLYDHARFLLRDYRDHVGRYDGVVSIEMFEAVGERYWKKYFRSIAQFLKPGAKACVQSITISDARFDQYRSGSDFIQQYIFPGGMLSSPTRFSADALQCGLRTAETHWFGLDYAETLRRWLAAFDAAHAAVIAQGYSERFVRMWRFYLSYCIAGFEAKSTDVGQFTLEPL